MNNRSSGLPNDGALAIDADDGRDFAVGDPASATTVTTIAAATGEVAALPLSDPTAIDQISTIPGGGADTARAVIGEIGLDMAVFGTAGRLCSWAKVSPRTVVKQLSRPRVPARVSSGRV